MDESQEQKSPSKKNLLDLRHEIITYIGVCKKQLDVQYHDEVYDAIKNLFTTYQSKPISYYIDNNKSQIYTEYKQRI